MGYVRTNVDNVEAMQVTKNFQSMDKPTWLMKYSFGTERHPGAPIIMKLNGIEILRVHIGDWIVQTDPNNHPKPMTENKFNLNFLSTDKVVEQAMEFISQSADTTLIKTLIDEITNQPNFDEDGIANIKSWALKVTLAAVRLQATINPERTEQDENKSGK